MLPSSVNMSMRLPSGRGLFRIALACCIFFVCAFPAATSADPLNYTNPEVTAYVHALASFRDDYLAAVDAARHGDNRKMKRMDGELPQWQEKAIRLVDKLEPNETKRFTDFVTKCGQTMMDAAYGIAKLRSG